MHFILATQRRSGTMMLVHLLWEMAGVPVHGRSRYAPTLGDFWGRIQDKHPEAPAYGVLMHFRSVGAMNITNLRHRLPDLSTHKTIWLTRENMLASYASWQRAWANRQHTVFNASRLKPYTGHVNRGEYCRFRDEEMHGRATVAELIGDAPRLEVEYTDLVKQRDESLCNVAEFIGVDFRQTEPPTLRIRTCPLWDAIDNAKDVARWIEQEGGKLSWLDG